MIFISHSSKNDAEALAVQDWLLSEGWHQTDIFLELESISVGDRWRRALNDANSQCEAVIVCLSDHWLASPECLREFNLAEATGKPIFPVIVSQLSSFVPRFITDLQIGNLSDDATRSLGFEKLRNALLASRISPGSFAWPPPQEPLRSPYRGLDAFQGEDAAVFFGRDPEICAAADTLRRMRTEGGKVLVILGSSGSGKSSFLRAGLLPRLRRDSTHFNVLPIFRPHRAAMEGTEGLAISLAKREALLKDGSPHGTEIATMVLPIDQGEELFSSENVSGGAALTALRELTKTEGTILVVTIRSDSYHQLQSSTSLAGIPKTIIELNPIPRHFWLRMIAEPAIVDGKNKTFSDALIDEIISDHQQSEALPLLSYLLKILYEMAPDNSEIAQDSYLKLGGIHGVLEKHVGQALEAWAKLQNETVNIEQQVDELFFPALISADSVSGSPSRRLAVQSEIPPAQQGLLDVLVEQRLVTRSTFGSETSYEVAHESLFLAWPLLNRLVARTASILATIETLRRDVQVWSANDRKPEFLVYKGARLESLLEVLERGARVFAKYRQASSEYLWECWRADFSGARKTKYIFLFVWLMVCLASLRLR